MRHIRIFCWLAPLALATSMALAGDDDDRGEGQREKPQGGDREAAIAKAREQIERVVREAKEAAERGEKDRAEKLERRAGEIKEKLQRRLEQEGRPHEGREAEIEKLEAHLAELRKVRGEAREKGDQARADDLENQVEKTKSRLAELREGGGREPKGPPERREKAERSEKGDGERRGRGGEGWERPGPGPGPGPGVPGPLFRERMEAIEGLRDEIRALREQLSRLEGMMRQHSEQRGRMLEQRRPGQPGGPRRLQRAPREDGPRGPRLEGRPMRGRGDGPSGRPGGRPGGRFERHDEHGPDSPHHGEEPPPPPRHRGRML